MRRVGAAENTQGIVQGRRLSVLANEMQIERADGGLLYGLLQSVRILVILSRVEGVCEPLHWHKMKQAWRNIGGNRAVVRVFETTVVFAFPHPCPFGASPLHLGARKAI
jgi:hypothetical protein